MIEIKEDTRYITIPTQEYCKLLESQIRLSILLNKLPNDDDLFRVSEIVEMLGLSYKLKESE